jgi:hypothetical protein
MLQLLQLGLQLCIRLGHGVEFQNGNAAIKWSECAQQRLKTCHQSQRDVAQRRRSGLTGSGSRALRISPVGRSQSFLANTVRTLATKFRYQSMTLSTETTALCTGAWQVSDV